MNLIESQTQFKFEYIPHVIPLIANNVDIRRESGGVSNKFSKQPLRLSKIISNREKIEKNPWEIVGLELNRKSHVNSTFFADGKISMKNEDLTNNDGKTKFFRMNPNAFQMSKRTNSQKTSRTQDILSPKKFWTTNGSELSTSSKSPIVSPRNSPLKQNGDDPVNNMTNRRSINPATLNPSVTILKKIPTLTTENQLSSRLFKRTQPTVINTGRELSPVKLPTLQKKSSSTVIKPVSSNFIQENLQTPVNTKNILARPILPTAQILPVYPIRRSVTFVSDPNQLPIIREQMIKVNLNQKATLKCKSPLPKRPDSSLSRSTTAVQTNSTKQLNAFNPLKYLDVGSMLGEAARHQLKRLFQQLDTDHDGHLTYSQVQKCLPSNLRRAQGTLFRVLYDLTTDATYFGLQEFYATAILVDMISKQDAHLWDELLDDVDFNHYRDDILEYLNDFDHYASSSMTKTINIDQLVTMIQHRMHSMKKEKIVKVLENFHPSIRPLTWTRLEFIGFLPSLIYIESLLDENRILFRFRENSILDSHMKNRVVI